MLFCRLLLLKSLYYLRLNLRLVLHYRTKERDVCEPRKRSVCRDLTVRLLQKGDEFHLAFALCDSRIDMAAARVEGGKKDHT